MNENEQKVHPEHTFSMAKPILDRMTEQKTKERLKGSNFGTNV